MKTYSPVQFSYLCEVDKQYRKCMKCESQKKETLKRSTECCHTICNRCLESKSEEFQCEICDRKLRKTDFTPYIIDKRYEKQFQQTQTFYNGLKDIERNSFETTPQYDDYLEKLETMNEYQRNGQTNTEQYKTILDELKTIAKEKSKRKQKEGNTQKMTIQPMKEKPKENENFAINVQLQPDGRTLVRTDQIGGNAAENIIIRPKVEKISEEKKKICGYDSVVPIQRTIYQAFNWF